MFSIKVFKIVKHVYYQSTFNCCRKENMNYLKMTLILHNIYLFAEMQPITQNERTVIQVPCKGKSWRY